MPRSSGDCLPFWPSNIPFKYARNRLPDGWDYRKWLKTKLSGPSSGSFQVQIIIDPATDDDRHATVTEKAVGELSTKTTRRRGHNGGAIRRKGRLSTFNTGVYAVVSIENLRLVIVVHHRHGQRSVLAVCTLAILLRTPAQGSGKFKLNHLCRRNSDLRHLIDILVDWCRPDSWGKVIIWNIFESKAAPGG
ncbi:hypothetical protein JX265_009630 [Neoarthrinium moseri]|uniref:Uncharacterized protein n=1 Tax=Neoarthrinium moseri TaxID=1658444 RepID=A0A9P9WFF9_9PEZI|nr:hypothetical protein JX266_009780 [Neoarthrinium moseri]KAI1861011.1 hypothetical protein JX265_009630 [Neoarthrinium moseri]